MQKLDQNMTHLINSTLLGITAVSWKFKQIKSALPTFKIYSQSKLCYRDIAQLQESWGQIKRNLNTAFPCFINKPKEVCTKT